MFFSYEVIEALYMSDINYCPPCDMYWPLSSLIEQPAINAYSIPLCCPECLLTLAFKPAIQPTEKSQ